MTHSLPVVLVLGPCLSAVSGVTTHVKQLLGSDLRSAYTLVYFQVGSEGRKESPLERLVRLTTGPFRLAAAIVRHDAAVVHINWSLNAKSYWRDLGNLVAAKICGAGVVFQKHGGQLPEFTRNRLFASFVRSTLRLPDLVVVLSEAERDQYRAFVPGQAVVAVPNGVDTTAYRYQARPPGAPLRLLYIGRLVEQKGVAEALRALAIARDHDVVAKLVIAGSGPDEDRLREMVRKLELRGQVEFVGPVAGEAKERLICGADVLMLATRYAEGLPYSLLEAMAAGAAPIVTRVGSIPEVVVDEVHALFVPPQDPAAIAAALLRLHRDRPLLARMSDACRQRVATAFTLDRLVKTFASLYSTTIPTRVSGVPSARVPWS